MMRHVYFLGGTDLNDIDVQIASVDPARRDPRAPLRAPMSTYLHMFGLDDFDNATGRAVPDGKFDNDINRIDAGGGFLFMPGVRPFSPSLKRLRARFAAAGVAPDSIESIAQSFATFENVPAGLYTLPESDPSTPINRYEIEVRALSSASSATDR